MTRIKVTTQIDTYLKEQFEATKSSHRLGYTEILEEKIKEVLMKVCPIEFLEHEIKKVDLEQEERRQTLIRLKSLEEERQKIIQQEEKKKSCEIEKNNTDPIKANYKKTFEKLGRLTPGSYEKLKREKKLNTNKEVDEWLRS